MIKILLSFAFSLFLIPSLAQQGLDEVRKIFSKELQGYNIKFTSSSSGSGIFLNLVDDKELKQYKLQGLAGEAFYINVNDRLIHIASSTVDGIKNGAWWYLHHLGFRYYFPNEAWYISPDINSIYKEVERTVSPSFTYRRIWYAYGTGSAKATADYRKWFDANLQGGEQVSVGHAYDGIVNRNKQEFLKHPEYFAQKVSKGTIPRDPKFEVSNENLVQLVIKDARKQIQDAIKKTGKPLNMISMDPSDGGGFSTSAASQKIGGPSEQVFYLANRVSQALRNEYPDLKIGLYAYNFHAAPPKIQVEPNITVLIATSMNRSEFRIEELVELWRKKGVRVGIRDYYGVMAWDWDMPGQVRGSKINYVSQLKDHHKNGIRLFTAETNIGWISRGPGHYLAARLLWDVELDPTEVLDEFYQQMFGKAAPFIKNLYAEWELYKQEVPYEGDLYKWMQLVNQASSVDESPAVQKRITQIKQYLHYVTLFKQWKETPTDKNLVTVFNYAYRLQDDGVVASYPLFRRLGNSYVDGKDNMRFDDPKAIWKKNGTQVSVAETESLIAANMKELDRKAVTIHVNYPASFEKINTSQNKESGILKFRGRHLMILQVENPSSSAIRIESGLIKAKEYKDLELRIFHYNTGLKLEKQVMERTLEADQPLKSISLSFLKPGVYLLEINDAKAGFKIGFSGKLRYGIVADDQNASLTFSRNNLVFNVNENISEFTVVNKGVVTLVSPTGRTIDLQKKKGRIHVQVLKNEHGTWKMQRQSGTISLQGVIPLLSDSNDFLIRTDD